MSRKRINEGASGRLTGTPSSRIFASSLPTLSYLQTRDSQVLQSQPIQPVAPCTVFRAAISSERKKTGTEPHGSVHGQIAIKISSWEETRRFARGFTSAEEHALLRHDKLSGEQRVHFFREPACVDPGHLKPCMADIYIHIDARMADYIRTHLHRSQLPLRNGPGACAADSSPG